MKIWLNTTPTFQLGYECDDDCGGDCTRSDFDDDVFLYAHHAFTRDFSQRIYGCIFQQRVPLHIRPCDNDGCWLVCHPSGDGRIVVMDAEALALLEQFCIPTTIHDVMQHTTTWSTAMVEEATALFLQLGLLQNIEQSVHVPEKNREEVLSAWLHITNACTLRCPYCYLHKTDEHMADDTAKRSVDAVFRSATRGHFQRVLLKYAGGEASLQMANVLATHDYATQLAQQHDIELHAYIMSNGVVLPQRSIEQLKERHIGVMISLDGIGDYHDSQRPFISGKGSFKYVDRTISQLIENNLMPHINVTVSQRNLDGLPDLTRYILERDLSFTFSYYRDNDCSTRMRDLQFGDEQMIDGMLRAFAVIEQQLPRRRLIDSLIDKANMRGMHQHTCGVGRTYMVIDQRGQVAKCHADIKQAITTIDADDPLQVIRADRSGVQAIPVEEKQGCRSCEWRHWCTGGCPLLTYRMTGRNDIRSPNCNIYKALFPEALRLEALRLLKYETPMTWHRSTYKQRETTRSRGVSAVVEGNAYGMQKISESVKSAKNSQSQENKIPERSVGKLESIQEAKPGSNQARAPEDFSNRVKLYIVGVPIDYKQEDPKRVREFENILIRAKRDLWPVYTSQPASAFMVSNKDGWETVECSGISIAVIRRNTPIRSEGNIHVANEVYALTQKSETPLILLRPGSPYLGDVPVKHLLLKFSHQMSDIEVLDARSGPDLVGDLAQSALQRSDLSRQYLAGVDILNISKASQIKEGLLLILALDDFYKKGYIDDKKHLFESVIHKIMHLGFEDYPAYIKSAQSDGLLLTVNELAERADEFNSRHGYTLAILNENRKR